MKLRFVLVWFFVVMFLLSGCADMSELDRTETDVDVDTTPRSVSPDSEPVWIGDFHVQSVRNNLEVLFSLRDTERNFTRASGLAEFEIVSEDGATVYEGVHKVTKPGFGVWTRNIDGSEYQAFSFRVPLEDIEKSRSSYGTATLRFTTSAGVEFEEIETDVGGFLPEYSQEELIEQAEQNYQADAVSLDATKTVDDYLSVTVHTIGIMEIPSWSADTKYIRVDVSVENVGDEKLYYRPDPIILGDRKNQFEKAYVSSSSYSDVFESGDIYPGVVLDGALFFELPKDEQPGLDTLIVSTGLSSYYDEVRTVGDALLVYDDEYVFEFDLSGIDLT